MFEADAAGFFLATNKGDRTSFERAVSNGLDKKWRSEWHTRHFGFTEVTDT
jgi:hypothetical protein